MSGFIRSGRISLTLLECREGLEDGKQHLQEVRRVRNSMFNLVKDRLTWEKFQRGEMAP